VLQLLIAIAPGLGEDTLVSPYGTLLSPLCRSSFSFQLFFFFVAAAAAAVAPRHFFFTAPSFLMKLYVIIMSIILKLM
jgi:hypothetical protein